MSHSFTVENAKHKTKLVGLENRPESMVLIIAKETPLIVHKNKNEFEAVAISP